MSQFNDFVPPEGLNEQTLELHPVKVRKPQRVGAVITSILVAIAVIAVGGVVGIKWYFDTHTLPNTTIAGTQIGVANLREVERLVTEQTQDRQVTITMGGQAITAPLTKLGVKIDPAATAKQTMAATLGASGKYNLEIWRPVAVPLVSTFDPDVLQQFIKSSFAKNMFGAKEATLKFDAAATKYVTTPSTDGATIDSSAAEKTLAAIANSPTNEPVALAAKVVPATFTTAAATKAAADLNAMIATPINIQGGTRKVSASPKEISTWFTAAFDPAKKTVVTTFDTPKITQWVSETVASGVTLKPVAQVEYQSPTTKKIKVVTKGVAGQQYTATQTKALVASIVERLKAKTKTPMAVTVTPVAFTTTKTNLDPDRYVEVNLTTQQVLLHSDDRVIAAFDTVSGKKDWETPLGTFKVWYKTEKQTMAGGSEKDGTAYKTENVKWATYFNGDIATHGAYWRTKFGPTVNTPVDGSHGCLNLPDAQAKIVYDFAPIGTKVVVRK